MATELKMPALSPTMEEGTLAKWLVKEGDAVKSGDLLAEIETDKATMEFEAVDEGTITKILVPEGTDGVKVGAAIALLAGEGESTQAEAPSPRSAAAEARPLPKRERGRSLHQNRTSLFRTRWKPPRANWSLRPRRPWTPLKCPLAPRRFRPAFAKRCATRWPRRCAATSGCS